MTRLMLDGRVVEVSAGAMVLEAARKLGIEVPTICQRAGYHTSGSCLVCLVKDCRAGRLIPSCVAPAQDGMEIETVGVEVLAARRKAVELLLSEHLGDCEAPCMLACPAKLDVPAMIRAIRDGRLDEAAALVRRDLALPAVLSHICHAPCEKACRRRQHDGALAIRLLERNASECGIEAARLPAPAGAGSGSVPVSSVAIIGSGPAGLAAAHELRVRGRTCTVYDANETCGGTLRKAVADEALPAEALEADLSFLRSLGVAFVKGARLTALDAVRSRHQAVILATGHPDKATAFHHGAHATGMAGRSEHPGVFVCGNAAHPCRTVIHAVADGKEAGRMADDFLAGRATETPGFTCHHGRLQDGDMAEFLKEASSDGRVSPAAGESAAFSENEAALEAKRCLHCDCRRRQDCRLRDCATLTGAEQHRFKPAERERLRKDLSPATVVFEAGKCVKCGLCISAAEKAGARPGLTFAYRGAGITVAAAFDGPLAAAIDPVADECIAVCPTGALARK
jgi:ferredoxin